MGRPRGSKNLVPGKDAIQRFEKAINMDFLRTFLDSQDIPKYQILLGMMVDPAYRRCSFTTLLRKAHISISEIQVLYADGMRHLGLLQMMNQLPTIMMDVADDARNKIVSCHRCDGEGFLMGGSLDNPTVRSCPICHGDKVVSQMGDKHARDLVFESAKLTNNNKGTTVAIQQNFDLSDAKMENLLSRTRSITLDKPSVVQIEPSHESNPDKDL